MLCRFLRYFLIGALAIYVSSCGSEDSIDPAPTPQVDCSPLAISIVDVTNTECNSLGSVQLSATGGQEPYLFTLIGGVFRANTSFSDLSAGNYAAIVEDVNECRSSIDFIIEEETNDLSISANAVSEAGCGTSDGEIEVILDNGTGDVEYSINGSDFNPNMTFTGLAANAYNITARDGDGCETTTSAQVLTGITLSGQVQGIVDANCAIPACHGGSTFPDFRQKTNILNSANSIASRTANGSMPPSGTLDQEQINTIACWVADGAPDN